MPLTPRSRHIVLLGAVLGAVLAATILTSPVADGATGDRVGLSPGARPVVGECHDLTLAQINAPYDNQAPVDCADSHTTRTVRVAKLPHGATWRDGAEALTRIAERRCLPAKDAALGRTAKLRNRSAYTWVWFMPAPAERDAGARWLRCDLALNGGSRMLPLPTDQTPALGPAPLADSVARCLHPDTLITTTCERTHTWRATGAFTLRIAAFPSEERIRAAAIKRCPTLVTTQRFRWTFRSEIGWELGDHTVVCYSKTRS